MTAESRRQRAADRDYAPHVPHDVGVLLGRASRQKPLAASPARALDFRASSPLARPGPAGLGGPLLGDDLGLELRGAGLFVGRESAARPAGRADCGLAEPCLSACRWPGRCEPRVRLAMLVRGLR